LSAGASASIGTDLEVSGDFTVDTNTLHVDSANNRVGIGTTTPTASLEVVGTSLLDNVYSESSSNWNFSQLRATRNASNTANTKIASFLLDGDTASSTDLYDSVNFVLRTDSAPTTGSTSSALNAGLEITAPDSVRFGTGSSERVRIDSSGNVGIGTTSPSEKLEVNGNVEANNLSVTHINVGAGEGLGDSGEDIRVGGIRGALSSVHGNQLIHLYNNVNIGYPTGWGGQDAPQYGLHVYGAITTSTHPLFIAYPSGTQDLGSLAKVTYTQELVDRGNNYDTSLSRFTAPLDGVYQFNHRWWAKIAVTGTAYTFLYKNGSIHVEMRNTDSSSNAEYETICSTYTIPLSAGDYIEVYASSTTGRFHRSSAYRYAEFSGYLLG
jgi:hypothetical protein